MQKRSLNRENSSPNTPFMKIKDAAQATGLSMYYLRNGCKDGSVPCIKSGTVYFVNVPRLLEKLDAVGREGSV